MSSVFGDVTPCSPARINQRLGGPYRLYLQETSKKQARIAACFLLVSCLAYSSTLKMEAICSSEMLIGFYRTTWYYTQEDRIFIVTAVRTPNSTLLYLFGVFFQNYFK
jgi:hypothetical protein